MVGVGGGELPVDDRLALVAILLPRRHLLPQGRRVSATNCRGFSSMQTTGCRGSYDRW